MANNIELEVMSGQSGAYKAGTIMATVQNADQSHSQRVVIDGVLSSTDPLIVETANDGYKSLGNSTGATGIVLAPGEVWNGTFDSPLNYGGVRIIVYATQASATNGLKVYCSPDGVNDIPDPDDQYTIPANKVKTFAGTVSPYVRVQYTNGAAQATVNICTLFLKNMSVVSSHRVQDNLNDDDDGQLTVSVLKLRTASNNYVSGTATNAGNFKTSLEEIEPGVVVPTTRDDDFLSDAFQRLRVSNTDQRLDVEFIYDKQPLLFDEITGGTGSVSHNANSRDVTLAVGGTGGTALAGLYQHFYNPYTPGNSQFIAITGTLNAANIAGTAAVYRRSKVTGTVVEEVIPQSSWLSATSGVNWNYSQIFLIDFQSLKVGRIRFALDRGGLAVPVATIENDNERLGGYWQTANAPVGWNIYNTATNTITEVFYGDADNSVGFRFTSALDASQSMRAICATVKSEGGGDLLDIAGYKFAVGNGTTLRTVAATLLPVLSIQLKTTFGAGTNRGIVFPQAVAFQVDNPIYYEVLVNASLTGASFASVDANSLCNFDVAASAVTGGRRIAAGYAASGAVRAGANQFTLTGKAPLSVNYAGTTGDILTIAAVRTTASSSATGAVLEWKEVR